MLLFSNFFLVIKGRNFGHVFVFFGHVILILCVIFKFESSTRYLSDIIDSLARSKVAG